MLYTQRTIQEVIIFVYYNNMNRCYGRAHYRIYVQYYNNKLTNRNVSRSINPRIFRFAFLNLLPHFTDSSACGVVFLIHKELFVCVCLAACVCVGACCVCVFASCAIFSYAIAAFFAWRLKVCYDFWLRVAQRK